MDKEQKKSFLTPCGKGELSIAQLKGNLHPKTNDGCKFHLLKELNAGNSLNLHGKEQSCPALGFLGFFWLFYFEVFYFYLFCFLVKAPPSPVTCYESGSLCFHFGMLFFVLTDASAIYFRNKGTQTAKEINSEWHKHE